MARVSGLMDDEALQQWALRQLGAPVVKIEVHECHVQDALEDAKRWFAAKKGVQVAVSLYTSPSLTEVDLPDIVDTVLDVYFTAIPLDLSLVWSPYIIADTKVPYEVFAAPEAAGIYSSLVQAFQYNEMARRILSADLDWFQQGRKLYLTPVPRESGQVIVLAKSNIVVVEQLNERDHNLVKRYTLATLMRVLSRIRGKYQQWPAAQGSVTLDADILAADAKEEFERLEEEIALSAYPIGFITG